MSFVNEQPAKTGGPYRKPRADLYTVLLIIALIAILLSILCLYFEMKAYDFDVKIRAAGRLDRPVAVATVQSVGETACRTAPGAQLPQPPNVLSLTG